MTIALVLGGGAPHLTLMAGAVAALDDAGKKFDIVSTCGAGALIGLLYAAPKGGDRAAALKHTVNMGVHDVIYRLFPVNYKVFHKPGTLAQAYTRFWQLAAGNRGAIEGPVGDFWDLWLKMLLTPPLFAPWLKVWERLFGKLLSPDDKNDAKHFFDDWVALMLATFCPSDLNATSQGMCQPASFVAQAVDFSKLKGFGGEFYMSAYCIETGEMEIFEKNEVTIEHFQAALAFPLIYPPFKINGKTYLEGAAIDTLNFKGLLEHRRAREDRKTIDTIVVLDVLGMKELIGEPRNLYDAWVKSIIVPLTAIAEDDIKLFEKVHLKKQANLDKYFGGEKPNIVKIDFRKQISPTEWPNVLDWSYGNLSTLYKAGYRAGKAAASMF